MNLHTFLKCTHNLFLKVDVQFKSERLNSKLPVIAKWEHIEKLYKHDKPGMIRTLYKLTDSHLSPVTHCSMKVIFAAQVMSHTLKGKAIPLQALTGPEGSRRLRLPGFKTVGTWRWQGCQPYTLAAFTPRKYSWYSFLLEVGSTPGP
jgi:hypothetical protein